MAQSFAMLVAARALQGAFGALLAPSALGLLTVTFAGSPDRPKAFGIFSAIAGGGASVGLLLGGVLTQALSWRWWLYVNLVIAVPTAILALRLLVNQPPGAAPGIDMPGVLLGSGGLFALVYGFSNAETHSWYGAADDRGAGGERGRCWPRSSPSSAASPARWCRCTSRWDRARGGAYASVAARRLAACSASSCSSPTTCSEASASRR